MPVNNWDFIASGEARINAWKNLRSQLTEELVSMDYFKIVTDFWSVAPLCNVKLDYDHPESWPDPWELMYKGDYSQDSVSLGILYTMVLGNDQRWEPEKLELVQLMDIMSNKTRIAVRVNYTWLINWEYRKTLYWPTIKDRVQVQRRYVYDPNTHIHLIT